MLYFHNKTQQLILLEHAKSIRLCTKPHHEGTYAIEIIYDPSKQNPSSIYLTFDDETEQRKEFKTILNSITNV